MSLPSIESARALQKKLDTIGNITSDGRPILGLSSKNLLEICLNIHESALFFPAHIWTPWFSVLGAKSGFDSIEECFGDLTPFISAIEMGLSSNPTMNWHCSRLDRFSLIANSDAHSPEKLGRNATIFDTELAYPSIQQALKSGDDRLIGTVSLFPQDGKYHFDGHRKCAVCISPEETQKLNGLCPICGKPVTIGVANRVHQLSDRPDVNERPNRKEAHKIIALKSLLSEIAGVGPGSKRVAKLYAETIATYGSELSILLDLPLEDISENPPLQEAIRRMRAEEVHIKEGFDGQFGEVKVLS